MCQSDEFREHVFGYGTAGVVESSLVGGRAVKTSHRPPGERRTRQLHLYYTYLRAEAARTTLCVAEEGVPNGASPPRITPVSVR